jgi:O-acetyl-ADP-ribose deacetylase (regulator of RNase III)
MISFREGVSIFDTDANILVNPVNTFGVSGAGLAEEFKRRFPENFRQYQEYCWANKMRIGKVFFTYQNNADGLAICNFPSKDFWSNPSQLRYIQKGLDDMLNYLHPGDTVAIPLLGCGLGGLEPAIVIPMMVQYLDNLPDVEVYLCFEHLNHYSYLL